MVRVATQYGSVILSSEYFANLVGSTASQCYGVHGMVTSGPIEGIRAMLSSKDFPEKGVRVSERSGSLLIELHIRVIYGVNICAIVKSITQKVKYTVEEATGLTVRSIDVFVDEMAAE